MRGRQLFISIESHVYIIPPKDYAEAKIHLDNRYANDAEWEIGLNIIREKGKFLYILDGNFNY